MVIGTSAAYWGVTSATVVEVQHSGPPPLRPPDDPNVDISMPAVLNRKVKKLVLARY